MWYKATMKNDATKVLLRRFHIDLLAGGVLKGIALGSAIAAGGLLAARAFLSPLPAAALAIFAAVPLAMIVCALRALTRSPSRATCLALVEDASHAGGMVLVDGLPGSERWPHPDPVTPSVPRTWHRAVPGALVALAALAAVAAAPDSWFAAGA
ncbi:MAG: hypothetical protein J6336_05880, partial [Kiritimatiellae bacterium]|nr:hypothetical protein [Kiritimatiellia bacterium]